MDLFQVALYTLPLCRKDPQGIFAEPVTDDIAPGYSALISNPMDFSTMAKKLDTLQYHSVDEYQVNLGIYLDGIEVCFNLLLLGRLYFDV